MRIVVSTPGRFHMFNLARQMARRGWLARLLTAYPKWKVEKDLRAYVATCPSGLMLSAMRRVSRFSKLRRCLDRLTIQVYDDWAARHLPPCDIVVALSGRGLYTFRKASKEGVLTVCDRGSTHILFQDEILAEEHSRWGIPYRHIDPAGIQKELQEYTEADLIVVPSTFVLRTFVQHGVPEAKLARIPYGVDLSLFHPVPKVDDIFRVIYVGAMSLRKGVPYLLEALATLQLPKFELCLIGGLTDEIKPFFKKYEGRFRYFGVIPRTKLYQYYSQGSVFVFASINDGFGLVQAQAMACGLPVIATTNTGAEDLFTDGVEGFIVPIRDPEAIREKVMYLYKHPEVREEMAQAALQRVKSMGGWNEYGKKAAAIYQEALNCHRSGRR